MASYPIAQNSVLAVTYRGLLFDQIVLNVLHYQMQSDSTPTDYQTLVGAMMTNIEANNGQRAKYLACVSSDYTLSGIDVQAVYPTRLVAIPHNYTDQEGLYDAGAFPPNVSAVLEKTTQYASRWGRGSVHLPAIPLEAVTGGTLNVEYIQILAELCGNLELGLSLGGVNGTVKPVLYHAATKAKGDKPATDTRITQVLSVDPRTTSRVMRRRTVGVGI